MSHKIYAASDAFLMPSLFEPCGLSQLISLRYGTVPIVRETGGLKDTVVPYNEYTGEGTGFSFANYNADEMLGIIYYAMKIYYDHNDQWKKIVANGMSADFSWNVSADKYIAMYREMTGIYEEVKTPAKAEPKPKKNTVKKSTAEFGKQLEINSDASAKSIADAAKEPTVIKVESPFKEEEKKPVAKKAPAKKAPVKSATAKSATAKKATTSKTKK